MSAEFHIEVRLALGVGLGIYFTEDGVFAALPFFLIGVTRS